MGVVPMIHWVLINGPSSDIVKVGAGEWAVVGVVEAYLWWRGGSVGGWVGVGVGVHVCACVGRWVHVWG